MSNKKYIKPEKQRILFDFDDDNNLDNETADEVPSGQKSSHKKIESDGMFGELEAQPNKPSMRFISFGSGSSGNSAYVGTEHGGVLIDAGVELPKIFKVLEDNGVKPENVKGICITHDHMDHIRYAYSISRKYKHIRIYCTPRVLNGILRRHNISRRIKDYHEAIYKEIPFHLAGMKFTAFEVPHDGSDNAGFFIEYEGMHFTIATDLGHISERAYYYMTRANFLMIESNYDAHMLDTGRYPEYLKNRVRGANGHLDNMDCSRFIADNYTKKLSHVFLCHLSNDNNTPEIAQNLVRESLEKKDVTVGVAGRSLEDMKQDVQLLALPRFEASPWFVLRRNDIDE